LKSTTGRATHFFSPPPHQLSKKMPTAELFKTLAIPLAVAWAVHRLTKCNGKALLAGLATFGLLRFGGSSAEGFHGYYRGHPFNAPHSAHPFMHPPPALCGKPGTPGGLSEGGLPEHAFGAEHGSEAERSNEGFGGDLHLTNLYRTLHNMDAIQRTEVFQFNDALAGGHYGIPRERYVGEAYDRGMMNLKQQIREDIGRRRRPYSEAYDVPTTPLMGNFWQCHVGDCQWSADEDGAILGIPSQVGTRHAYY
jgi:hypothetical protein